MSVTAVSVAKPDAPAYSSLLTKWGWPVAIAALFVLVHQHFIERSFRIATNARGSNIFELLASSITATWNRDWSYTLVIPFISGYYIFQHRERLMNTPHRVFFPGLLLMLVGLTSYAWWLGPGRNDMFSGYSMILTLFGLVLFLLGPGMMKILWFPIAYLILAVKISDRIWDVIAWKLQLIAANAATVVLKFLGAFLDFDAENRGSTIDLSFASEGIWQTQSLNVAEACSGLRMLAAFVALSVAMAFLTDRRWWQRLLMVAMAIPIAVLVNVGRVAILGLLFIYDPESAKGSAHTFVGMLMLIPAAMLFWLLGWVLDKMIVAEKPGATGDSEAVGKAAGESTDTAHADARAVKRAKWSMLKDQAPDGDPLWKRLSVGAVCGIGLIITAALTGLLFVAAVRPDLVLGWPQVLAGFGAVITGLICAAMALVAWRLLTRERKWHIGAPVPYRAMSLCVAFLAVTLLGLTATVNAMQVVLIKEAVPLRLSPFWSYIPREIGPYTQIGSDQHLSEELLEELGTELYLSRTYRDTRVEEGQPGSIIGLHLAYYTGLADTVPHVPDRCFVAGGAQGLNKEGETLMLEGPQYRAVNDEANDFRGYEAMSEISAMPVRLARRDVPATLFTFGTRGENATASNVVYFFSANGQFLPTPERVRLQGFDFRDRYSYYCKIEVLLPNVADGDEAVERAARFLSYMMPEIMACLPDWVEVKAGNWPEK